MNLCSGLGILDVRKFLDIEAGEIEGGSRRIRGGCGSTERRAIGTMEGQEYHSFPFILHCVGEDHSDGWELYLLC